VKLFPNLYLARRIAVDIGCDDPHEVHRAMQPKAPGLLFINARRDELTRDQYEDLCYAIELELKRVARPLRLVPAQAS
jgi:hypothetical protein